MRVLRSILAVIVGYLVTAAWVMITLTAAWLALGAGFAFREGSFRTSAGWCVLALVTGSIGAVLGGLVAALIAPRGSAGAVRALAVLILVLGLVSAGIMLAVERPGPAPGVTPANVGVFEAQQYAMSPPWYNFTIAFVGCAGVLLGGMLRGGRKIEAGP